MAAHIKFGEQKICVMRRIIAEISVSLDGFIEGPYGELDWLVSEDGGRVEDFLSRFDVIFYGRMAYEKLGIHHLPERTDGQINGVYEAFSKMRKYVFSHSCKHVPGNAMVINSNIIRQVKAIREEEGRDIWLSGGAGIIQSFAALNMIDEYHLLIQPVILGGGKPLFSANTYRQQLRLSDTQQLQSGVVLLTYTPNIFPFS